MLSCKEFVLQASKIIENEELALGHRINNQFHLFFCHHCRNYLKQAKITASVAKNLQLEPASKEVIEETVSEMNSFSSDQ